MARGDNWLDWIHDEYGEDEDCFYEDDLMFATTCNMMAGVLNLVKDDPVKYAQFMHACSLSYDVLKEGGMHQFAEAYNLKNYE